MDMSLTGKTAVVTGGSKGIGLAVVQAVNIPRGTARVVSQGHCSAAEHVDVRHHAALQPVAEPTKGLFNALAAWLDDRDAHRSVSIGIGATARVITTAAAIMIVVFTSFVIDPDPTVKMLAIGMAFAVLIDASLVRMALVPSIMALDQQYRVDHGQMREGPRVVPETLPAAA
jgi:NAD(P)-dependent dehydrogenase (short-subunit alcohol dehydrogenase family)